MNLAHIAETLEEMLSKMNFHVEDIEVDFDEAKKTLRCLIKSDDAPLLIGADGKHFGAFNHIAKRLLAKKITDQDIAVTVDVNGYQEQWISKLKMKAQIFADRARSLGIEVEMEPMSSYERMVIHGFFEGSADIKTESRGEGRDRHLVIKTRKPEEAGLEVR